MCMLIINRSTLYIAKYGILVTINKIKILWTIFISYLSDCQAKPPKYYRIIKVITHQIFVDT